MPDADPLNLPEHEFDAVMNEIDEIIRARNGQIPGREIVGYAEFAKRFQVSFASDHPMAERIFSWFNKRYGDRLNMDWDFGQSVVLIQGDVYRIRVERFYGTRLVVCSSIGLDISLRQSVGSGGELSVENLLVGHVENLTLDRARKLSVRECEEILKAYGQTFLAFSGMEAALGASRGGRDAPYIKEAMHDLRSSCDSMLTSQPNCGQAKWEALHAVEKVVKSCILEKGAVPKRTHNLTELCAAALDAGVPQVDQSLIALVQCPAEVRYDSSVIEKSEALAANHAALRLCATLAPLLKRTTAQSQVSDYSFPLRDVALPGLMLVHLAPIPPFTL
jgi:hypothetical protein